MDKIPQHRPGEDYPIQVYIEDTYLGDTLLGETRQDVDSGPNVYTRSFDLPIPRSLCDGKPHQLVLKDHHRPSLLFLKKNFKVSTSELSPKARPNRRSTRYHLRHSQPSLPRGSEQPF